jgi:hypothetical protein
VATVTRAGMKNDVDSEKSVRTERRIGCTEPPVRDGATFLARR